MDYNSVIILKCSIFSLKISQETSEHIENRGTVRRPNLYPFFIVAKNDLCFARWDRYPVIKGDLLVIPFRRIVDYFSLTANTWYKKRVSS